MPSNILYTLADVYELWEIYLVVAKSEEAPSITKPNTREYRLEIIINVSLNSALNYNRFSRLGDFRIPVARNMGRYGLRGWWEVGYVPGGYPYFTCPGDNRQKAVARFETFISSYGYYTVEIRFPQLIELR